MESTDLTPLPELEPGTQTTRFMTVAAKSIRRSTRGSEYWNLELEDASGRIKGKVWEPGTVEDAVQTGDIVKLMAQVESYQNNPQLKVLKLRLARDEDAVPEEALYPSTPYDVDAMYAELLECIDAFSNTHLKALCESFFRDDEAFIEAFQKCPAGRVIHHPYVGGMVEHVLSLVRVCSFLATHYPGIDRDLLLTGALFHDCGKIRELDHGQYTVEGELLGHTLIGYSMVKDRIREMGEFPEELEMQVLHLVLSHQGQLDWGAPVVPKLREAFLLHFADNMDAKYFQCARSLSEIPESGGLSEKNWLLNRRFYKPANNER